MTISNVSFRANETTGGVADRTVETAKQETTGGVGVRKNDSIFVDNELKQDTVCFRGSEYNQQKNSSPLKNLLLLAGGAAAIVGGLGLAHKYNVVDKLFKEGKTKDFFKHTDAVTEPCHKACAWIKRNSYDKIVKFFNK